MSISSKTSFEIHVCYGHEHLGEYPHWLLSLQSPGASQCTWIHSTGGPSQGRAYECSIQANKHIESAGIASSSIQGYISPRDVGKVIEAAEKVEPQQCQMYVIAVVAELEKTGLLPRGRTAFLKTQVQMSQRSIDYRQRHPVAKPAIAYTQEDHDDFYGRK